jgi:hydroxyacylglutathione hydrolase
VLFQQFLDESLGCASYLVGDEASGDAVVVDPAFEIERYVDEAARRGVAIRTALETHTHADHVSGHGRLALEHDVPVRIHPAAEPRYPAETFEDGDVIEVGQVSLRVIHTPGHRPEHCCFAVADLARASEPWLVLTGDSLLVGDVARPDLAVEAHAGATALHASVRRLLELSDGVEVFPGHVAGSLCGAAMSSKGSTTIGFERRFNPALRADVDEFAVGAVAIGSPRPPNMERIVELNGGPFVGRPPDLRRVEHADGATVLDVRPVSAFVSGHVPGAISVPLGSSSFATKAAFVLLPDEPVVLHAASADDAERAARALASVGLLELEGYLDAVETPERVRPLALEELEALLARGEVQLLDVREKHERDSGYIPGSRNIPYRLLRRCSGELRDDVPVVTICETGTRAAIAASVLAASGLEARPVLDGGVPTWRDRGKRTTSFRRCGA